MNDYIWIVTGTRNSRRDAYKVFNAILVEFGRPRKVVIGDARGVDRQALLWCKLKGIPYEMKEVDKSTPSPTRYHNRNQKMADEGTPKDICIALPDDDSRGTWDCVNRCKLRGIRILER